MKSSTDPLKDNPKTIPRILSFLSKLGKKTSGPFKVTSFDCDTPLSKESTGKCSMDSEESKEPSRLDQDYEFISHLGKGNFSSVNLYMSKVQRLKFAIKKNKTSSMSVN
jgi:hypothetical protein